MAFRPEPLTWRRDVSLTGPASDAALASVRALYARLENPLWMKKPDDWAWVRPSDHATEGFAMIRYTNPGMANLLWLAMDMDTPPWEYEMRNNGLMVRVLTYAGSSRLDGEPLLEVAALLPLERFHSRLCPIPGGNPLECAYPLLKMLANQRLHHA